jgi:hypothetical protein
MSRNLRSNLQIARLAMDLRLQSSGDPVAAIVAFCNKRVQGFLREFRSSTLSELLSATAARLETLFVEIHDESDLDRVRQEYVALGEVAFATLREQLKPDVYAITFKRTHPREGDRRFVSVIDCRGEKAWRSYFSKWHELAHLLTLTTQARLIFRRTHTDPDVKDPEEVLMDIIAGDVAFFPELVRPHVQGEISFEAIASLKEGLCPEASRQASTIGFVKAWPTPCILIEARLALRDGERRLLPQGSFDFRTPPTPVLRAVHVTANAAAERVGALIPRNMRIPAQSVIALVFADGVTALEAQEDLAWWESSSGRALLPRRVTVKARRRWDAAEALVLIQ